MSWRDEEYYPMQSVEDQRTNDLGMVSEKEGEDLAKTREMTGMELSKRGGTNRKYCRHYVYRKWHGFPDEIAAQWTCGKEKGE